MAPRILRLDPGTPLQPMDLDPADFASPLPRQHMHVAFTDTVLGMNVGLWETSPMQEAFGPYPGDEFIVVLDGAFAMMDGQGRGTPAHKGQGVAFRSGAPVSWMQPGFLRKAFVTLLPPGTPVPHLPSAEGGVIVLDPEARLTDDDDIAFSDSGAKQRDRVVFTNDAGTMTVGLWDTEAMTTTAYPFPYHELAHVVEGSVTITGADGTAETFGPGDIFFIPAGAITQWDVPRYLRKHYAAITASA